jgi:hypothetical protein
MSQPMSSALSSAQIRLMTFMHRLQQLCSRFQPTPIAQLLLQVETATTPAQLEHAVNTLQQRSWSLPAHEQEMLSDHLIDALRVQILGATRVALRIEAAGWLRLLTQAGLTKDPRESFVTLVTAAVRAHGNPAASDDELLAYLKTIAECFLAFRYPYPAFSWQLFPDNAVFYPLAPLLIRADSDREEALLTIFAELSALDDPEIREYLLPVALRWSNDADAEHRRTVTGVITRMSHRDAQDALQRLQFDADPVVRASARHAASYGRIA